MGVDLYLPLRSITDPKVRPKGLSNSEILREEGGKQADRLTKHVPECCLSKGQRKPSIRAQFSENTANDDIIWRCDVAIWSRSVYSCSGHMSDAQTLHPLHHCMLSNSIFGGEFDDLDQTCIIGTFKISLPTSHLIYLLFLAESTCVHFVCTLSPSCLWQAAGLAQQEMLKTFPGLAQCILVLVIWVTLRLSTYSIIVIMYIHNPLAKEG